MLVQVMIWDAMPTTIVPHHKNTQHALALTDKQHYESHADPEMHQEITVFVSDIFSLMLYS